MDDDVNEKEQPLEVLERRPSGTMKLTVRHCPICKLLVEGASSLTRDGAVPKPGDATICQNCTSVLAFTVDGLELVSREHWQRYPIELRRQLAHFAHRTEEAPREPGDVRDMVISRGPTDWRAVMVMGDAFLVSGPKGTREQAQKLLEAEQVVSVLSVSYRRSPDGSAYGALVLASAFGKRGCAAALGPFPTDEEARRVSLERVREIAERRGDRIGGVIDDPANAAPNKDAN